MVGQFQFASDLIAHYDVILPTHLGQDDRMPRDKCNQKLKTGFSASHITEHIISLDHENTWT